MNNTFILIANVFGFTNLMFKLLSIRTVSIFHTRPYKMFHILYMYILCILKHQISFLKGANFSLKLTSVL